MHVAHVITRLIIGGAQENTLATVLGLHGRRDLDLSLISGPTRGAEGSLETRIAHSSVPFTVIPSLVRPIHPWHDLRALGHLTRIFRKELPAVVHTHSGKAGILGRLAARKAGVKTVIHSIHGPSFGPFQNRIANQFFLRAEKMAGRKTDHFVVVAQAMADQYLAKGIGRPEQYSRVWSGFNLQPFLQARNDPALRAQLGLQPEDLVVGKVARLFKLKGHDDLIAVAARLAPRYRQLKFLLVGDGPWRDRLQVKIRAAGLEGRFVFAGLVTPEEVPRYLGVMDVLVHLSAREGLPRAVAQAMAASRPVVAYDVDGTREICRTEQTGLLIRQGNLTALESSLIRLIENQGWREELGRRGQALALEFFPVEKMLDDLEALYRRLTSASRSGPGGAGP